MDKHINGQHGIITRTERPRYRRLIKEDSVIETWTHILIATGIIKDRDFSIED